MSMVLLLADNNGIIDLNPQDIYQISLKITQTYSNRIAWRVYIAR